ncbi:hypothetical protein BH23ACT9_BH23ACT9_33180 [soil metagenome]
MGWKDRDFTIGPHTPQLFDRNGNAGATVWLDGRAIGGWAQHPDAQVVTGLLEDVGSDVVAMVDAQAARLTSWLDGTVVSPRFPAPLDRQLARG